MHPDPALLDELVRLTVEAVHPQRVILFGSAARGTMGPDSDLDVLVVMPDAVDCLGVSKLLYRALRGLGKAKDILVISDADLDRYGSDPYLVYKEALTEGRELYHVDSVSVPE
jgi:predicted nucleotidyltransferase